MNLTYAIYIGLRIPVLIIFSIIIWFWSLLQANGSGNLDIICSNYGYENLVTRDEKW